MHLKIGPVDLQLEHTSDVQIKGVMDDAGLDLLYYEVSLSMLCVWHPWATATTTGNQQQPPADSLGITVANLRSVLMAPRQQVKVTIGPDRAFTAPINDANGNPLPCDPAGGPFVEADVLEVLGDKGAMVMVRVRLAFNDYQNLVVSNRWSVRSDTDAVSQLTRRTVEGIAVLRMDYMNAQAPAVVPDMLRQAFVMPPPAGFIRKSVNVVATPDGARLRYSVLDTQQRLNLGAQSPVTRVEGDATAGVDWPFHEIKGVLKAMGSVMGGGGGGIDPMGSPLDNIQDGMGKMGGAAGAWAALIPTAKAQVVTRVYGKVSANYSDLVAAAVIVCMDRFAPLSLFDRTLFPVSNFVTVSHDNEKGPFVQCKMEFLPVNANAFLAMLQPARAAAMLNMNHDIKGPQNGAVLYGRDPALGNPSLPASGNTRGSWVAFMVGQILAAGAAPVGPPPPQ